MPASTSLQWQQIPGSPCVLRSSPAASVHTAPASAGSPAFVAAAQLCRHIFRNFGDAWVVVVLVERLEQIQLGVFLDLDTQVVQLLDGRIAGKEIGGTRARR